MKLANTNALKDAIDYYHTEMAQYTGALAEYIHFDHLIKFNGDIVEEALDIVSFHNKNDFFSD